MSWWMRGSLLVLLASGVYMVWSGAAELESKALEEKPPAVSSTAREAAESDPLAVLRAIEAPSRPAVAPAVRHPNDLPPSFSGTVVDGGWPVDERGHLLITAAVRDRFDYFLLGLGEMPLAELVHRLQSSIRMSLEEPAQSEALQLLEDYLALQRALTELAEPAPGASETDLSAMAEHLRYVREVRRAYLSPEAADAFYGEEEQYDQYMLNWLQLHADETLTEAERQQAQSLLRAELPQGLNDALAQVNAVLNLAHATADLQRAGASDSDVHQLRVDHVGEPAAQRLADLDQQRAQWQRRVDAWLSERDALMNESEVEQRRAMQFSQQELQRVMALERLADSSQP